MNRQKSIINSIAANLLYIGSAALLIGCLGCSPSNTYNDSFNHIHVSYEFPQDIHVEPHLAIHPLDVQKMCVASIVFDSTSESANKTGRIRVFITSNFGKEWNQVFTSIPANHTGDPWVQIDSSGQIIVTALGGKELTRTWRNHDLENLSSATMAQRNPQLSASEQGVLGISWIEQDTSGCIQTMVAFSNDQGTSFTPKEAIHSELACSESEIQKSALFLGMRTIADRFEVGGEYYGFSANRNGNFYFAYCGMGNGVFNYILPRSSQKDKNIGMLQKE